MTSMTDQFPGPDATDDTDDTARGATHEPSHEDGDGTASVAAVTVRRNVALAGTVGGLATLLAVAFAVRAFGGGSTLDWLALGVLAIVALGHLAALLDARAPLMVVDDQGVRVRDGAEWQGVAWGDMECLEHLPRRSLLRDGHVLVVSRDDRQLLVPLTLATTVAGASRDTLSDALAALAAGRTDVVEVVPGLDDPGIEGADAAAGPDAAASPEPPPSPSAPPSAPSQQSAPSPQSTGDDTDTDEIQAVRDPEDRGPAMQAAPTAPAAPVPGRATVLPARAEYPSSHAPRGHATQGPEVPGTTDAADAAAGVGRMGLAGTEQAGAEQAGADTMTVVLSDLDVRPAAVPVIGPQLAAARQRLRLSVDQLSERTRIRPHVIEAIEVDDFAPCGGDFYARGHLRTMARVLGVDAAALVATYDDTYADAPVDPRRVFESELATGVGGSIRGTRGGRNWSVLIGSVMAAVLVWSLAQLLMGGPTPVGDTPVLSQTGSGGVANGARSAQAVPLTLTAAGGGARVLVRDGKGDIVFDGQLAFGQTSELDVVPPVRIQSSDGSVTASLDGAPTAALGGTGEEVTKTLVAS